MNLLKDGKLEVFRNGKYQPSSQDGFNLPNIFEVIKRKIDILIDFFLSNQPEKVKEVDSELKNALHYCVFHDYLYGFEAIASKNIIDVNAADKQKVTPLSYAAIEGNLALCKALLKNLPI